MAILQYIGARYVPKFYVNSLDGTTLWENNVTYEPLTWVTLINGSMYLSKRTVPNSIGTPASNPDYWLEVGQFNGYIRGLQDEVNALQNALAPAFDDTQNYTAGELVIYDNELYIFTADHSAGPWDGSDAALISLNDILSTLNTAIGNINDTLDLLTLPKRVVTISDSYGTSVDGATPWTSIINSYLSATDYYTFSEGAMGFNRAGHSGHTAQQLIELHSGDIPDHDTITDFIIALGINDLLALPGLDTAIKNCINYVKLNYPNAKIYVGFIGNAKTKNSTDYQNAVAAYRFSVAQTPAIYLNGVENIMHNYRLMQADGVHPTSGGADEIARGINAAIRSGSYDYYFVATSSITSSYLSNVSQVRVVMNGNITSYYIILNVAANMTLPAYNSGLEVGEINNSPIWGYSEEYSDFTTFLYDGTNFRPVSGQIIGGKIYLNSNSISSITVPSGTRAVTPMLCTVNTLTV